MIDKPLSDLIQIYAESHTAYAVASGSTTEMNRRRLHDKRGDAASVCLLAVITADRQRDRLRVVVQMASGLEAAGYPVPDLLTKALAGLHDSDLDGPMLAPSGETGAA